MVEEKSAAVDPHQLLKALSPLLGMEGEIKGAAEMDRVMSLMKDAKKLVSRCIYVNILKATKNTDVLARLISRGGWDVLYTWLKDAKEEDNIPFIADMLKVYQNIPMTVDVLKMNNTPKTIKSLSKCEDDLIKTMAKDIVEKWMKTVISKPSDSDKKKSKPHHSHHSSRDRDRERDKHKGSRTDKEKDSHDRDHKDSKHKKSSDSSKDSKKSSLDHASPASKNERGSSTDSQSSSVDDKSKSKQRPRTAKAPPSLYRSTGLETETVLPPKKKKVPTATLR